MFGRLARLGDCEKKRKGEGREKAQRESMVVYLTVDEGIYKHRANSFPHFTHLTEQACLYS